MPPAKPQNLPDAAPKSKPVAKVARAAKAASGPGALVRDAPAKAAPAKAAVAKVVNSSVPAAPAAPTQAKPRARPVITPGSGNVVKLKDLLDHVAKATGAKKKSVRDTVEATLTALGDALSRGDDLNLPALGKAHVNRQRTLTGGEMIIVKLRRHDPKDLAEKGKSAPLAATAKDS